MSSLEDCLGKMIEEYYEARERKECAWKALEIKVGGKIKRVLCADIGTHISIWAEFENNQNQTWWRQFNHQKNTQDRDSFIEWIFQCFEDYKFKKETLKFNLE